MVYHGNKHALKLKVHLLNKQERETQLTLALNIDSKIDLLSFNCPNGD